MKGGGGREYRGMEEWRDEEWKEEEERGRIVNAGGGERMKGGGGRGRGWRSGGTKSGKRKRRGVE